MAGGYKGSRYLIVDIPEAFIPLGERSRYKAFFGGRGSGKSYSFAKVLLGRAWTRPHKVLCTREIQKSIKESVKAVLEKQIYEMGMNEFFRPAETEIVGANASRFIFAGLKTNPEAINSLEGVNIAWVEEAQTISQKSIDQLEPTIRELDSEIWYSWNPRRPTDPVDAKFRSGTVPPRSIVREVHWYDNPWFPDDLREHKDWMKARDPDKYAHVYLGTYQRRSEARVFNNWVVEEFDTPDDAVFHYGADWGFAVDPTVLIRCFIKGAKLYVDREVYKIGCQIEKTPALFDSLDDKLARKHVIRADSARPETIDYVRRHDYPKITYAIKGKGSVEDGVEFIKNYDVVVHPRCRYTIDELTLYSYKIDPQTDEVLPVLEDKDNNVMDALRYAVEGVRRGRSSNIGVPGRG